MDILYLSQYFYPEQFLNNHIAKSLVASGHEVDVVCCVPNYPVGRFFAGYSNRNRHDGVWEGVRVHRVFTVARGRSAVQLIANYLTYPIAAAWRLFRLKPRAGSISFVSMPSPLFQALAGIFAKRMWRIPTVYWVQDIWPDSAIITLGIRNRVMVRVLNAICGWIYRQADLVMVQSDGFHANIAGFGVPADRIVTLPNCAPDSFRPIDVTAVPERIRSLVPQDRRTIMFAGNIGESQDFDTIIAAAALLPDASRVLIVVVGSGRDEERVKARISDQGLAHRFLFLGRHPEADMPAFFACADAMLVSLRDEPIFALTVPSKVQAYMACGKPILASLKGEGAVIVSEASAGVVVPPSAPMPLAAAMDKVASLDEEDLRAMGRRSRQVYEQRYSLNAVTGKLVSHLEAVLAKASSGI
ncbi:glycosyltransferase family 4 protein [Sphingomonas yabuuchiae]|uniref:Glycosyltransferase family 4 protein n=1 Tax=Sphingomonas yabuuchiae TaxID=172044 RepID=A0AA40ZZ21_9SPHN|nr:glycosyltransferase family 4 protein [Sphingomonas yabuuchiae]MBB4611409.1 glycosyltransferase involved in cell wall biosynthesis [Sphingomonas yabuuchiae]MBN3556995.1 glycosyltransferase family 4 protein [Sphingomonas yabuuchiae]